MGELSQSYDFISSINSNSACMTPGCKGKLVCTVLKRSGLGGAVDMYFTCNGCDNRKTRFQSSTRYKPPSGRSSQSTVGFMLEVAFLVAGCPYAKYLRLWVSLQSPPLRLLPPKSSYHHPHYNELAALLYGMIMPHCLVEDTS